MVEPRLRSPIVLSILAAVLTIVLKGASWWITDSVGLLSDAAESVVNLVAALTAFLSLLYAARPVDPTHTYGHEKIEFFSAGLEGALILVAALTIIGLALHRLLMPAELDKLDMGAMLNLVAALVNFLVSRVLLRAGRASGSIVLEAEGHHLATDVWTSCGVVAGLAAVWTANSLWRIHVPWIDPLIALLVAANISRTGMQLVRRSFNGLMDHALPEAEQAAVRAAVQAHLGPGMDYHALRTRQAGTRRFADFHLLVPGDLTVRRAHEITGQVEEAIRQALPGIEVTVHIEPIEDRRSWEDSALVPLEQAARRAEAERTKEGHNGG